jgi:hypothetical protein
MARQETILNVFISSPSDVVEDRDTVEEIIEEVSKTLSSKVGVRLVPLRWETDVTPNIGTDPQNVINAAVGGNYDVFVGIMGARFGDPTPRFGSGTEEEFTQAYEKHIADIQDGFESITEIAGRITTAMVEVGNKTRERTAELNAFNQQPDKDFRHAKRIFSATARDMDEFCARLEPELKLFSNSHAQIMDRTIKWVSLIRGGGTLKEDDVKQLTAPIEDYINVMGTTIGIVAEFRNSVANLPRVAVVVNKSRNRMVKSLDGLIEVFTKAKNLSQETQRIVSEFSQKVLNPPK